MKPTNYILDRLKKTFKTGEKYDSEGFPDMNYIVGNTSGMDIGNVPSPLDQRIGRMAQLGGSIMEVQITNPATFQIDRPEIINVVDRLDLDMTLHGDPNLGFTAAYATGGRVTGYNIVHRYFKRYLEQMAAFKYEVDQKREDPNTDVDFHVGYVNIHASNEMIPALEERLASDVSVDPFGHFLTDINGGKEPNIYKNPEFLKKLFEFWFIEKVDQPFQFYENVFSDMSPKFNEAWKEAKSSAADRKFGPYRDSPRDVEGALQTVTQVDQGKDRAFLDALKEEEYSIGEKIRITESDIDSALGEIDFEALTAGDDTDPEDLKEDCKNDLLNAFSQENYIFHELSDFQGLNAGGRMLFNNPRSISRDLYDLEENKFDISPPNFPRDQIKQNAAQMLTQRLSDKIARKSGVIEKKVVELANNIWDEATAEAKISALSRNLDIQQSEILEEAEDDPMIREEAAPKAFSGDWDEEETVRGQEGVDKPSYEAILERLSEGRLSEEFNKESSIFFHIMPAWMMTADEQGFNAPKFIWDEIVERDFENYEDFKKYIHADREHQLDVIAAVGSCYIWGHFTQNAGNFEIKAFNDREGYVPEHLVELAEAGEETVKKTWIRWMNDFGLKVNIEAMYGSPGELRRVWRPKDIAIACHAIDMTAREQLGEDYEETLVKFTIDMEHTSSYGVDPVNEINTLITKEGELSEDYGDHLAINKDKPLSHIVKTYHLTKPGWERSQGHRHGPFARGDKTLYRWLYELVNAGFTRNEKDPGIVMFEVGGEYHEEMYTIRVAMNMIELGIAPEDLDGIMADITPGEDYENEKQALVARFFGMDQPNFNREWAKIEEHAFDPLKGLLEAEDFEHTFSGRAALEEGGKRAGEWQGEEYR